MQRVPPYMDVDAKDEANLLKEHITYAPIYNFHRFINKYDALGPVTTDFFSDMLPFVKQKGRNDSLRHL